eukprot:NODE_39_length_35218_cov_0.479655.p8 type:complete len:349 gc:universal NODE_39_length_35218_cov_0.479655:6378-5332(-)
MDIIAQSRSNHLHFDDYQTYAKSLSSRIKKERKKNNTHLANLLLVEKNVALGMMHSDRVHKLKKFKKAHLVLSKLTPNDIEKIYFACVSGLYCTYAKLYEKAFSNIQLAINFFKGPHYPAIGDSLISYFEDWKKTCEISIKQVLYQLQLKNTKPEIVSDLKSFSLGSSGDIMELGSKKFRASLTETFSIMEFTGDAAKIVGLYDQFHRIIVRSLEKLKQNSFEKQYLQLLKLYIEGVEDLKDNFSKNEFEAGKSIHRFIKRIGSIKILAKDLITDNHPLQLYLEKFENKLSVCHSNITKGAYSGLKIEFSDIEQLYGIPRTPHFAAKENGIVAKQIFVSYVHLEGRNS